MRNPAATAAKTSPSLITRLVAYEITGAKVLERLLDLRSRIHHERPVAGDRLVQRPSGGEGEAPPPCANGGLYDIAAPQDYESPPLNPTLPPPHPHSAHAAVLQPPVRLPPTSLSGCLRHRWFRGVPGRPGVALPLPGPSSPSQSRDADDRGNPPCSRPG